MDKVLFSSDSDEWGTPNDLFDEYDRMYNFNLDPCGHPMRFLKEEMVTITLSGTYCRGELVDKDVNNGLIESWKDCNVFVNPPYTKKRIDGKIQSQIALWTKKIYEERNSANVIVLLCPARTDTIYFHEYIYNVAELTFLKGRLKFYNLKGGGIRVHQHFLQ